MLDDRYDAVRLIDEQRHRVYDFGGVLVARAGTRRTATDAGVTGRRAGREIEAVARDLGLPRETRARFEGRGGQTAPCELAIFMLATLGRFRDELRAAARRLGLL